MGTCGAEGRVVDDGDQSIAEFKAQSDGIAAVTVPYDLERTYHIVIDRPAGVTEAFRLPEPTGHRYSIYVDETKDSFRVSDWRETSQGRFSRSSRSL